MVKVKILMVCLGNICRSPLAQGILESKVNPRKVFVDSAGTAGYHEGKVPDLRSINIAKKNGINIQDQKARQFTRDDFNNFSKIYVMDKNNYKNVILLAETFQEKAKVQLLLEDQKEVLDPFYGGEDGFNYCFQLLDEACNRIRKSLY
jgi:protein-tyrosine phosphatase